MLIVPGLGHSTIVYVVSYIFRFLFITVCLSYTQRKVTNAMLLVFILDYDY